MQFVSRIVYFFHCYDNISETDGLDGVENRGGGSMTKEDRIGRDGMIKKKENRDREKEELLDASIDVGTISHSYTFWSYPPAKSIDDR